MKRTIREQVEASRDELRKVGIFVQLSDTQHVTFSRRGRVFAHYYPSTKRLCDAYSKVSQHKLAIPELAFALVQYFRRKAVVAQTIRLMDQAGITLRPSGLRPTLVEVVHGKRVVELLLGGVTLLV